MRLITLLLPSLSTAHFILKSPLSIGFEDSTSSTQPCGGFTPDLNDTSKLQDVHVGGEAIALQLTHSRCTWLFRATLDPEAKEGWEKIYPITVQSGLGDFCVPSVTFPEEWAGKKGVIGIVSSAEDGQLYQCIAANFVAGVAEPPTQCKNATRVSAYPTTDATLEGLLGSPSESTAPEESSSAPSSTESPGAAAPLQAWGTAGLGSVVTIVAMFMLGGALMI